MTDAAGPAPDQLEELIAARVAQLTAELQAREQDLRNQNILFNAALTNMSQGLVMFDAQGRVVICNQRYLDMYGLTRHRCILDRRWSKFCAIGSRAAALPVILKSMPER
jgi:PAS domain-containing protein